jgi:hypothetical protein
MREDSEVAGIVGGSVKGLWPVLKLHPYFRSSASYRCRIALNLKGLSYDTAFVHLVKDGGKRLAPTYRTRPRRMRGDETVIPAEGVSPRAGTQGHNLAAFHAAAGSRIFAYANSGMTADGRE